MSSRFHYLCRGIIRANGMVLLAHQKGADNTFLPGGHIEFREQAEVALIREIKEEIGKKAVIKGFVGAVEAGWQEQEQTNHEINLIFEVAVSDLDSSLPPDSLEDHLEFIWSQPEDLRKHNLLPEPMIDCITGLKHHYHGYWGSYFE
jgi:8-oxo-dGTP diphosphatase